MTKGETRERKKRFSKALPTTGKTVTLPRSWQALTPQPIEAHEPQFLEILAKHGIPAASPVPLVGRYSKPRRWSAEELSACVDAHRDGVPIGLMSAALNRNPQDIIFRLLDECNESSSKFTEVGLKRQGGWDEKALVAARELFEAGLTAWRVAALFGVDFEGVEKALYMGRSDYGHKKKNPFAICTDHKQIVNEAVLSRVPRIERALDAFAGEGRFSELVLARFPQANITCIEQDDDTFQRARTARAWPNNATWISADNLPVLQNLNSSCQAYDLIDLDPFVSCREQFDLIWGLLSSHSYLFFTFGGEYRRSFIGTNRKAIERRYGFHSETLSNSDYLEIVPAYFLGWVATQAAKHGFVFDILYCIRYPNNCRYWTQSKRASTNECADWLSDKVESTSGGHIWKDLGIPRFSEVRGQAITLLGEPKGEPFVRKTRRRTLPAYQHQQVELEF